MKYKNIQGVVLVYGTKESIQQFLESNEQAIDEAEEEEIELWEVKGENLKHLKRLIWRGD